MKLNTKQIIQKDGLKLVYKVFDNLLTQDEQEQLNTVFFDHDFPYYMSSAVGQKTVNEKAYDTWSDSNTVEARLMVHSFITDKEISRYYQGIEHLLHLFYERTDIKFSGVYRCKLNLQYQVADFNKDNYQCPHMDQVFDHKVLIYYPFTSDGDTFLFNQVEQKKYEIVDRIEPIGGRFLLMDKMFHAGQPPIKNIHRMVLNYNLKE